MAAFWLPPNPDCLGDGSGLARSLLPARSDARDAGQCRQLLPEDANCKDAPDPGDRTCGFDSPLPSKVIYAKDTSILAPILRQPASSNTHPRPQIEGFRFPQETQWGEFLHRYYKPVADACVRWGGGCPKLGVIEVGDTVTLSGSSSSDSDGPAMDDTPQQWYWDKDLTKDSPALDPVYPITSTASIDPVCSEDCDRDSPQPANETDDDPDVKTQTWDWICPAPGTYVFRLIVHDEHNDQSRVHEEETHYVHWKVDDDRVTIICIWWWITKTPDPVITPPGEQVAYTLVVGNTGPESGTFQGTDELPAGLTFQPSSLRCSTGECNYDPSTNTVYWEVTLDPDTQTMLDHTAVVDEPPECPPPGYEIVNRFRVTDNYGHTRTATGSVQVTCGPSGADLSLTKRDNPDPVLAGTTLDYELVVVNNGPDEAGSVVLSDHLPDGVTLLGAEAS